MTQPQLIALTGLSGCGKDTFAKYLTEKHGYVRVAIADEIKQHVKLIFGLSNEQLWGELRNTPLAHTSETPRTLYQKFGALCVALDSKVWLRPALKRILELLDNGQRVVCTDVRLQEELHAMRKLGALIVLLYREGAGAPGAAGEHHTEKVMQSWDNQVDVVHHNNGTLAQLQQLLWAEICNKVTLAHRVVANPDATTSQFLENAKRSSICLNEAQNAFAYSPFELQAQSMSRFHEDHVMALATLGQHYLQNHVSVPDNVPGLSPPVEDAVVDVSALKRKMLDASFEDELDASPQYTALREVGPVVLEYFAPNKDVPSWAKMVLVEHALQPWLQLPMNVLEVLLHYLVARALSWQVEMGQANKLTTAQLVRVLFKQIRQVKEKANVRFIHGMARAHKPQYGSWALDAAFWWGQFDERRQIEATTSKTVKAHTPMAQTPCIESVLADDWPGFAVTKGRCVVIVGGNERVDAKARLTSIFCWASVHWIPRDGKPRVLKRLKKRIKSGRVDLVVLLKRFSGHDTNAVVDVAKKNCVPVAFVEQGYGVEQVRLAIERYCVHS